MMEWRRREISIERGVVKQIPDTVKAEASHRAPVSGGLLNMLKQWRQTTQFSSPEDWVFASPRKLGRQPICYT
jgi:hypothetical protein